MNIRKSFLVVLFLCIISSKKAIDENRTLSNFNNSRLTKPTDLLLCTPVMANVSANIQLQESVRVDGRFKNPWPTWKWPTFLNMIKFMFETNHSNLPSKEEELDESLPILKPDFNFQSNKASITWIGHSTVLINFDNITILTDPIFSHRASFTQLIGPARFRRPAVKVDELPPIDAVVISHNHYDHLDVGSVKALNARFGDNLYWFVPLELADWMRCVGCNNVIELDWWQHSCIPNKPEIKFVFTPAQHWTKRGLNDDCKVLWGSWSVIGPKHRFFFAGDTGYCPVFKEIGETYGPFDISAIPIGAYEPRWFMRPQHVDPEEAVEIHKDVKSKFSVGVHWGTFALAHEYYLEPPMRLKTALQDQKLSEDEFITLSHGETKII